MEAIVELINKIERIGDDHSEVYDTDVKESVYRNLLEVINGRPTASDLGMFSKESNNRLRQAIEVFGESVKDSGVPLSELQALLNSSEIKSSRGQSLDVFWGSSEPMIYPKKDGLNYKLVRFLDKPYTFPLIFIFPSFAIFFLLWLTFPGIFRYQLGLVGAFIVAGIIGLVGGAYFYEKLRGNKNA